MNRKQMITLSSVCAICMAVSGCSKPAPHLGEDVSVEAASGITAVQRNSRSLLPSGGLAGEEVNQIEIEATVDAVNGPKRLITLSQPNGEKIGMFEVSPEVRNFDQIRAGDKVKIAYKQALAFEVREPTTEEVEASRIALQAAGRAPKGSLPAAGALTAGIAVVTIQKIDRSNQQLTVRSDDGRSTTIKAKYPENLAHVKEGQKVVVTYAESVVAGVERVN